MSDTPAVPLALEVDCYAGHRGDEVPRRFRLAGVDVDVVEVIDRWLAPDHRYFKVHDARGDLYILRHDVVSARWELTFFRQHGYPASDGSSSSK